MTASFGISALRRCISEKRFVREADVSLYASKVAGSNRVTHASDLSAGVAA